MYREGEENELLDGLKRTEDSFQKMEEALGWTTYEYIAKTKMHTPSRILYLSLSSRFSFGIITRRALLIHMPVKAATNSTIKNMVTIIFTFSLTKKSSIKYSTFYEPKLQAEIPFSPSTVFSPLSNPCFKAFKNDIMISCRI